MTVPTSRATGWTNAWTGIGPIPAEVQGFWDSVFIETLYGSMPHMGYGLRRNIPANSGRTATFEKANALSVDLTAIPEFATPDGQVFSTSYVVATINEYGTHVPYSRRASELGLVKDLGGKIRDVINPHRRLTFDQLTRDALAGGTVVNTPSDAARGSITSQNVLTEDLIKESMDDLIAANGKTITKRVEPSDGVGTAGFMDAYICFAHVNLAPKIQDVCDTTAKNWIDVADYPSGTKIMEGEIGAYRYKGRAVRFICSTNGKIFSGLGSGNIDVYALIFIAKDAYIETTVNGKNQGVIVKALGSEGSADPYNSRGSIAWAEYFTATIADDALVSRVECAL